MCNQKYIPVNLVAKVDDSGPMFYKSYYIMCKIDTGIECSTVYVAQFFKKEAADDYVDLLNHSINDDLFITYFVEEDDLYEKK